MTLSEQLGHFAAGLTFAELPPDVVASVRDRLLDTVGLCLAGSRTEEATAVLGLAAGAGGAADASAIGFERPLPAAQAALINGLSAHALDFDDTHLPSILHPSAVLIPAALAVAEAEDAGGRELAAALAAGYEVDVRLGMAAYDEAAANNAFFERGLHATSICGTLAAAVVAGRLMRLPGKQVADAIGIAASMGAGIIEANRSGGSVKKLHCGLAARAGIEAARMARAGITGPPTALEGRFGFYAAFVQGAYEPTVVVRGLGAEWETPRIFYKPYPANHFTHTGIEAARRLRLRAGFDVGQVRRLELRVATPTLRTIAEPREEKVRPRSGYHAKFSGPYTVAAALLGGGGLGLGHGDFTDTRAADPAVLQLAAKVYCVSDPRCDAVYPRQFPAVLVAQMEDRSTFIEEVMENFGSPQRPLGASGLRTKFDDNCAAAGLTAAAPKLAAAVADVVEEGPARMMRLLREVVAARGADPDTKKEVA